MHDVIDWLLAVGGITATVSSVFVAFHLSRRAKLEDKVASHDRQIRDNRTATAECRAILKLPSYPYVD